MNSYQKGKFRRKNGDGVKNGVRKPTNTSPEVKPPIPGPLIPLNLPENASSVELMEEIREATIRNLLPLALSQVGSILTLTNADPTRLDTDNKMRNSVIKAAELIVKMSQKASEAPKKEHDSLSSLTSAQLDDIIHRVMSESQD